MVVSLEIGAGSFCICVRKASSGSYMLSEDTYLPKVTPSHFPLKLFSVLFEKGWVKFLIILSFLCLGIGMLWHFLDGMLPMHPTLHNQKHGVCLCLF